MQPKVSNTFLGGHPDAECCRRLPKIGDQKALIGTFGGLCLRKIYVINKLSSSIVVRGTSKGQTRRETGTQS